jgi:plasmid maintenance system killer protein
VSKQHTPSGFGSSWRLWTPRGVLIDVPGFRLYPLKGKLKGRWSFSVNGNWRLSFEFTDGIVYVLDYEDYH